MTSCDPEMVAWPRKVKLVAQYV